MLAECNHIKINKVVFGLFVLIFICLFTCFIDCNGFLLNDRVRTLLYGETLDDELADRESIIDKRMHKAKASADKKTVISNDNFDSDNIFMLQDEKEDRSSISSNVKSKQDANELLQKIYNEARR